jgi:hypothetical protein
MSRFLPAACALLAILPLVPGAARAVSLGQQDTFQDGTTQGWHVPGPSPVPPANSPSGGPAGAGDAFLVLTALGNPAAGGRLSVLNSSQWSGDYLGAGVSKLVMAVNNFGPDDLFLRLLFEDFAGAGPPVNLALSAQAVFVPAGSGWRTVTFPIAPADLVAGGIGTVLGALASVDTLRLFHNPEDTFPGPELGIPPVAATLGVDDVAAIPEPTTALLLTGGLAALGARKRARS